MEKTRDAFGERFPDRRLSAITTISVNTHNIVLHGAYLNRNKGSSGRMPFDRSNINIEAVRQQLAASNWYQRLTELIGFTSRSIQQNYHIGSCYSVLFAVQLNICYVCISLLNENQLRRSHATGKCLLQIIRNRHNPFFLRVNLSQINYVQKLTERPSCK